jgi:hypothetical protein
VPEAVKFHASQLLSGAWDPYPIDMGFQPPCMVGACFEGAAVDVQAASAFLRGEA